MRPIQRSLINGFAVAALLLVGASAVHAQRFEPNGAPYACTWRLGNGVTGVSLVTFTFTSGPPGGVRQGTVRNFYADGSQIVRSIQFFPDIQTGNYVFKQDNVTCQVQLFSSNREVVFTECTNGVQQNCRQWQ